MGARIRIGAVVDKIRGFAWHMSDGRGFSVGSWSIWREAREVFIKAGLLLQSLVPGTEQAWLARGAGRLTALTLRRGNELSVASTRD